MVVGWNAVVGWNVVVGWNAVVGWNMVIGWNTVIGWVERFNRARCLGVIGSCFDVNPCNLCTSELGEVRLGFKLCKVRSGQVRSGYV